MRARDVLVVEDNPVTRKLFRTALELDGFTVREAGEGQAALALAAERLPDLAILDLALPDMDGGTLAQALRALAGDVAMPILLVTGRLSALEALSELGRDFDDVLAKPVEPDRLLDVVRAHLGDHGDARPRDPRHPVARHASRAAGELAPDLPAAVRGRVLVVDDEPLNRELTELRLRIAGFAVDTAASSAEALEKARADPPDAILSDVLMPGEDGFELCRRVRQEPPLAHLPIVLLTSFYLEEADRRLAIGVGADALVARTPDLRTAIEALAASRARDPQAAGAAPPEGAEAIHRQRLLRQLERQLELNKSLAQRSAMHAAALSLLSGICEALAVPLQASDLLGDALVHCLDAAGLSAGLLYTRDAAGALHLHSATGFPTAARGRAESCWGHPEVIGEAITAGTPVVITSERGTTSQRALLAEVGLRAALIVPFSAPAGSRGALFLASDAQDLGEPAWASFARALAAQLGQAMRFGDAVAQLARSEERYRTLFDGVPIGLYRSTPDGRLLDANAGFARIVGAADPQLLRGVDVRQLQLDADDRRAWREQMERDGEVRAFEMRLLRLDRSVAWVRDSARAVRDDTGRIQFHEGAIEDVTERRSLEAQLRQSQKMEAIGRLAGGVAHDFNNLLTAILGYGALLGHELGHQHPLHATVQQIERAAERAATLTRQLLAFSRKQVLQPRVLDLNHVLGEMEGLLRRVIGEDVELFTAYAADLGHVRADLGQLEQVLLNLVVNARDAMPHGGRLSLQTSNAELDASYTAERLEVAPGRYAVLAVSDTGVGMDESVRSHIFEPFFTTKEPGKGTGLGLATAYGIVKQSGGHIGVYSEPGKGTTFRIYLPLVHAAAEPAPPSPAEPAPGGDETILVVEDEDSVRRLACQVLAHYGYRVLEAASGGAALALLSQRQEPVDLLLTDVVMPGISGLELAREVAELRPETRTVFMSGYAAEAVASDGEILPGISYLEKPFTPRALALRVREALDRPASPSPPSPPSPP